ncbi:MAG TPA: acylphosphatase [Xanthomonadaceae bacterium]|nr:acylphosphatase [Xanthomonadaceae bacterium]
MAAARFLVSGRVQGVAFRAHAREEALRLGLRGYARNLADGRVEVVACGDAQQVDALAGWLQHGPPLARVDDVERQAVEREAIGDGFSTA